MIHIVKGFSLVNEADVDQLNSHKIKSIKLKLEQLIKLKLNLNSHKIKFKKKERYKQTYYLFF